MRKPKKRPMRRKWERKDKGKGYDDVKRTCYDRKEPRSDYLKYFRIIRYWVKRTTGLSLADLEMLLFLYSERLFTRTKFSEFEQVMTWDVRRFNRLKNEGWISIWRPAKGAEAALYEVSFKGKKLITGFYKKLQGEELMSECAQNNPMFRKNTPFTDKVYRRMIVERNKEI